MRLKNLVFASLLLLASGCTAQQEMVRKQSEMESRLEFLAQGNKLLTAQVAQLSDELKQVKDQLDNHSSSLRDMKAAIERAGNTRTDSQPRKEPAGPSVTKIELINNDTGTRKKSDESSADYMKAFGLYSANNYNAAVVEFKSYLQKYPGAEFAVNARYWIGECYYSMSDLPKALESFNKVVEDYPTGKKVPDAMLKIGYTQFAMKEPDKARATLAALVERFPESPAATKARERLGLR